jgi:hypothetical protein
MHSNGRGDQIAPERTQSRKRPFLVGTGKPAVSGYICCENGCEFPSLCHIRPFTARQISTIGYWPGQVVSPGQSSLARGDWLRSLGLERYEAAFCENEIDETVSGLTAEDFEGDL